ncbi:MAG: hypothetical protein Q8M40_00410 [Legionella sp.]|nr:hypothetical protein [Legionella sp.]
MANIRVLSIGFDGCLSGDGSSLKYTNKLIPMLEKNNESYEKTVVMVGSTCQSGYHETQQTSLKGTTTSTCYDHLFYLSTRINATFDQFLMSHVYNGVSSEAISKNLPIKNNNFAGWLFDYTRISVLYAQMYYIFSQHPEDKIDFNYYHEDINILKEIALFFKTYARCMPIKLKLSLYLCDEESVRLIDEVQGQCTEKKDYVKTIQEFGSYVLKDAESRGKLSDDNNAYISPQTIIDKQYNCNYKSDFSMKNECFSKLLVAAHYRQNSQLLELQSLIKNTVDEYTRYNATYCKYSLFHRHGQAGRIRAKSFSDKADKITSLDLLKNEVEHFLKDQDNGNTNPHSFRTMLAQRYFAFERVEDTIFSLKKNQCRMA